MRGTAPAGSNDAAAPGTVGTGGDAAGGVAEGTVDPAAGGGDVPGTSADPGGWRMEGS